MHVPSFFFFSFMYTQMESNLGDEILDSISKKKENINAII